MTAAKSQTAPARAVTNVISHVKAFAYLCAEGVVVTVVRCFALASVRTGANRKLAAAQ